MLILPFLLLLLTLLQSSAQIEYLCDPNAACGCSTQPALLTKIVGGEAAPINTWGWMVSLSINDTWLCGGTILSSSWVVTAAHCVDGSHPWEVFVSAATNELYGAKQWRYASSVIVHPQYDAATIENDIALIQVSPPFNMTDPGISKICLPIPTTEDFPPINSSLVAIGWGLLSENGDVSETLQQVTVERIAYESKTCYPLITNESMQFCAGVPGGGKDACSGDSGGPLMMFTSSQQWITVGITSYGIGCARPRYDGIYTRLVYFLDWIQSMNVTDVTVGTTTTTIVMTTNMSTQIHKTSNSTNNSLSCYQNTARLLSVISIILLLLILFFKYSF